MRGVVRFVGEFVLAMLALCAGLGCLWIVAKIAPPVIEFIASIGL